MKFGEKTTTRATQQCVSDLKTALDGDSLLVTYAIFGIIVVFKQTQKSICFAFVSGIERCEFGILLAYLIDEKSYVLTLRLGALHPGYFITTNCFHFFAGVRRRHLAVLEDPGLVQAVH